MVLADGTPGRAPAAGGCRRYSFPRQKRRKILRPCLEARERTRLLYRLLDELDEVHRTTFILFEMEGLSGEEIAAITDTRISTVWVRLSRARRKFIERMRALEAREKP